MTYVVAGAYKYSKQEEVSAMLDPALPSVQEGLQCQLARPAVRERTLVCVHVRTKIRDKRDGDLVHRAVYFGFSLSTASQENMVPPWSSLSSAFPRQMTRCPPGLRSEHSYRLIPERTPT